LECRNRLDPNQANPCHENLDVRACEGNSGVVQTRVTHSLSLSVVVRFLFSSLPAFLLSLRYIPPGFSSFPDAGPGRVQAVTIRRAILNHAGIRGTEIRKAGSSEGRKSRDQVDTNS
jgi:hypothetical protein